MIQYVKSAAVILLNEKYLHFQRFWIFQGGVISS